MGAVDAADTKLAHGGGSGLWAWVFALCFLGLGHWEGNALTVEPVEADLVVWADPGVTSGVEHGELTLDVLDVVRDSIKPLR